MTTAPARPADPGGGTAPADPRAGGLRDLDPCCATASSCSCRWCCPRSCSSASTPRARPRSARGGASTSSCPGVIALCVISASFTSQAIATGFDRKDAVLRYLGTTPLGRGGTRGRQGARDARRRGGLTRRHQLNRGSRWAGVLYSSPACRMPSSSSSSARGPSWPWPCCSPAPLRAEAVLALANLIWVLLLVGRRRHRAAQRSCPTASRRSWRRCCRRPGSPTDCGRPSSTASLNLPALGVVVAWGAVGYGTGGALLPLRRLIRRAHSAAGRRAHPSTALEATGVRLHLRAADARARRPRRSGARAALGPASRSRSRCGRRWRACAATGRWPSVVVVSGLTAFVAAESGEALQRRVSQVRASTTDFDAAGRTRSTGATAPSSLCLALHGRSPSSRRGSCGRPTSTSRAQAGELALAHPPRRLRARGARRGRAGGSRRCPGDLDRAWADARLPGPGLVTAAGTVNAYAAVACRSSSPSPPGCLACRARWARRHPDRQPRRRDRHRRRPVESCASPAAASAARRGRSACPARSPRCAPTRARSTTSSSSETALLTFARRPPRARGRSMSVLTPVAASAVGCSSSPSASSPASRPRRSSAASPC